MRISTCFSAHAYAYDGDNNIETYIYIVHIVDGDRWDTLKIKKPTQTRTHRVTASIRVLTVRVCAREICFVAHRDAAVPN